MKLMRLAMCVAVFALVGGIAVSEDMDIKALQAKLAAQEARLNDLQAKMGAAACEDDTPKNIVSMRKNAKVTIGGTLNTTYYYNQGKIKSSFNPGELSDDGDWTGPNATLPGYDANGMRKVQDLKTGNLEISDAKLAVKIDVNEYFDAYLRMDLQDGNRRSDVSGVAQYYWVRWKNLCNSGFGVLIGRDTLKFGGDQPIGVIDSWNKDSGGFSGVSGTPYAGQLTNYGEGMFGHGNMVSARSYYNETRTTQITPYWENQDGTFKAEVSFIQGLDRWTGGSEKHDRDTHDSYRSINYGLGSMTGRITWKPIEGLKIMASVMNLYARNGGEWRWGASGRRANQTMIAGSGIYNDNLKNTSNNIAANIAFTYRPCFFNKLNIWASYTHGWNEYWVKDQDSDVLNYGASYDFTDRFTYFAQGDFLRTKNDQGNVWHKATGWAAYTGLRYTLPYGVNFEVGYRYEQQKYKNRDGVQHTKASGNTVYGRVGFAF